MANVCAVIVTYNRMKLLKECVSAILHQTVQSKVLVIDNASTDGTSGMLAAEFPQIQSIRLPTNIGGAGGFHEGIKRAYQEGHDWIWVMDDDTVPQADALEKLLVGSEKMHSPPLILASVVKWSDGTVHPMNVPRIHLDWHADDLYRNLHNGLVPIRAASFVSLLISRQAIERYGLPVTDYFIWVDDIEFTARILRQELGALVLDSVAIHNTRTKYVSNQVLGGRYFYHIRNTLWMLLRSDAWVGKDRRRFFVQLAREVAKYMLVHRFHPAAVAVVVRAVMAGVFTKPKQVIGRMI